MGWNRIHEFFGGELAEDAFRYVGHERDATPRAPHRPETPHLQWLLRSPATASSRETLGALKGIGNKSRAAPCRKRIAARALCHRLGPKPPRLSPNNNEQ